MEMWMWVLLLLFLIYIAVWIWMRFISRHESEKVTFWGPVMMLKTQRGKGFIDRLASHKRFWVWYANVSLFLLYIAMLFMFLLLLQSAILASQVPASAAPTAKEALALPGINPLIPLWYGVLGLIVAVVFHEFSHGILSRVGGIKVKSIGVLIFAIPIGAFVEPDEDGLAEAKPIVRSRVYAAGPGANFFLAFVTLLIFSWGFMGSVEPARDGMVINSITEGFPAEKAGLEPGMVITHLEASGWRYDNSTNTTKLVRFESDITDVYSFYSFMDRTRANDTVTVTVYYQGKDMVIDSMLAFTLNDSYRQYLVEGPVAPELADAFHKAGYAVGNASYMNRSGEDWLLDAGEYTYRLVDTGKDIEVYSPIILADKYDYLPIEDFRGRGFLGVATLPAREFSESLAHPIASANSTLQAIANILQISFFLPLQTGIMPFHAPLTDVYEIHGPLAALGAENFWVVTNALYYIFWLNLLVGTFNALPAVPLDGGIPFRDGMNHVLRRFIKDNEKRERLVDTLTLSMAVFVLLLIIWIFIGPRIM